MQNCRLKLSEYALLTICTPQIARADDADGAALREGALVIALFVTALALSSFTKSALRPGPKLTLGDVLLTIISYALVWLGALALCALITLALHSA